MAGLENEAGRVLAEGVVKYGAQWEEMERYLEEWRACVDLPLPPELSDSLFDFLLNQRILYSNVIAQQWGYNLWSNPPQWFPDATPPQDAEEQVLFYGAIALVATLWQASDLLIYDTARAPREQRGNVALRAVLEAFDLTPLAIATLEKAVPLGNVKHDTTLAMAGWAHKHLSLAKNSRLRLATATEATHLGEDKAQAYRQMLPGSVSLVLGDMDLGQWESRTFINQVAEDIGAFQPDRRKRSENITVGALPASNAAVSKVGLPEEEFFAVQAALEQLRQRQERVEELHAMWRASNLTEQQFQVMEYSRQGLKQDCIAEQLNTSTNNVKQQKRKAIEKIERYQASTGT
ncbi:MAG: LuxR C-terminal-related transcriptional regulator [Chloroflexota bacterium]|nr:LuxR C-terminal-related transcriptional regulator [Chloroflexota bacterium]